MHDRQLERLTRIFTALLSPLGVGCGIDERQFSENLCDGELEALALVEPAQPVDYVELRVTIGSSDPMSSVTVDVRDSVGQRCSGASDVAACEAAFAALPLESEFSDDTYFSYDYGGGDISLGFTRGDEVGSVNDLEGLLWFLGDIDAPGDAALLLDLSGREIVCNGENDVGERDGGFVVHTTSGSGCGKGNDVREQVILVKPDGSVEEIDSVRVKRADKVCPVYGRLPAGSCTRRVVPVSNPLGVFFAEMSSLEAAAIPAFGQLAQELALHGAPRSMIRAALRSRRDEIRHARVTARLARRHGGRPIAPRVAAWAPRGLAEVVADNALEGCVRETYGALVAHVQARRARDPMIRRVLARIALDETRHAALSWNLAGWAQARMSAGERQHVARAGRAALERMQVELTVPQAPEVHAATGLPEPELASALFGRLRRELLAT